MWILKKSKERLENLKDQAICEVDSIKTFDCSTHYTTIPHDKLTSKLREIINYCCYHNSKLEVRQSPIICSQLNRYLCTDKGKLITKLLPIVNSPFLSSNNPSAPAYGCLVSQYVRYARACCKYQAGKLLTSKLFSQGYRETKPVPTVKKFYRIHHDLVDPYNVPFLN